MDSKYFDTILRIVNEHSPKPMTFAEFTCHPEISSPNETNARNELKLLGYITETEVQPYYIHITGKGQLFLSQGGFVKEEQRRNLPFDTVRIAKQSKRISIAAIVVSVLVAIAVAYFQYRTK